MLVYNVLPVVAVVVYKFKETILFVAKGPKGLFAIEVTNMRKAKKNTTRGPL